MVKIDMSSAKGLAKSIRDLKALKKRLTVENEKIKSIPQDVYKLFEVPLIRRINSRPVDENDDRWKGFVQKKISKNPLIKDKSILDRIREIDPDEETLTRSQSAKRVRSQIRINGMLVRKSEIQKVVNHSARKVNVTSWKSVMFDIDETQTKIINYIRKRIKGHVKNVVR